MKAAAKLRIDQLLVERGLAESREKAQALVLAGEVRVAGQKADKPGRAVAADAPVEVTGRLPYVSRGGVKLAAALDHFAIDVTGKVKVGVNTLRFEFAVTQDVAKARYEAHPFAIPYTRNYDKGGSRGHSSAARTLEQGSRARKRLGPALAEGRSFTSTTRRSYDPPAQDWHFSRSPAPLRQLYRRVQRRRRRCFLALPP